MGRADDAIAAYEDFIAKHHGLPEGEALTASIPGLEGNPAKQQSDWEKAALYQIAKIRYGQKKYEEATKAWESYVNKYPDGPDWSACQRGIIDARHQIAMDAVEAGDYPKARKLFEEFLAQPLAQGGPHPLPVRANRLRGRLGTGAASRGGRRPPRRRNRRGGREGRLRGSHRPVETSGEQILQLGEASLALYRIALIHEEKFGDWKTAWKPTDKSPGEARPPTPARVGLTTRFTSASDRQDLHSDETPVVRLTTRTVKKVTVKQYFLDLEAYRKTHAIESGTISATSSARQVLGSGGGGLRRLPPHRADHRGSLRRGRVGACLLNASDDNFEATTIVIRSDSPSSSSPLAAKPSPCGEPPPGKPAAEAKVLLSDGKKVLARLTEKDGVFRQSSTNSRASIPFGSSPLRTARASNLVGLQSSFNSGLAPKVTFTRTGPPTNPWKR